MEVRDAHEIATPRQDEETAWGKDQNDKPPEQAPEHLVLAVDTSSAVSPIGEESAARVISSALNGQKKKGPKYW